jgi:hypothetical protein
MTGTPAKPLAGRLFTVRTPIVRSDTGQRITSGQATCNVRVGSVAVPAKGSVQGGAGRCSFRVPTGASGKRMAGTIVVRSAGTTVSAGFAFAIR